MSGTVSLPLQYAFMAWTKTTLPVAYRGPPAPKFRRYRWSPRPHEQEEPESQFPFVVHCVLIWL